MNTQRTEEEAILRRHRPAALPQGVQDRLLSAMLDTARETQHKHTTLTGVQQQAQPAALPRSLHTRLLAAMMTTAANPRRKWYSYRRTAVACIALLLLFGAWLGNELLFTPVTEQGSLPAAINGNTCFAVAERSILPAETGSTHCLLRDTLTIQDADSSVISIRVSASIAAPLPDDVI